MSAYPYLPLFTKDFLADTMHLSAQETGAYLLLLIAAWQSPACELPDDDRKLARWARVSIGTWREIKSDVMSFWTLADGHWQQNRLLKERQHAAGVAQKRQAAARKRWSRTNASAYPEAHANAYPDGYANPHANGMQAGCTTGKKGTRESIHSNVVGREYAREEVDGATFESLDDVWGAGE